MIFSFYYTDKIATFVLEKNSLYQKIDKVKDEYITKSVSAEINGNYIIPGLSGMEVNVKDSYYNMKNLDAFNEYYLVYQTILPDVTIEKNKDKIINQGNKRKKQVTFILENDDNIISYFTQNNIKSNLLVTLEEYKVKENIELINNDHKNYDKVESLLNNANLNKNLCVINNNIEELCREKEKYLIEPKIVNNVTFLNIKKSVDRGDILLIKKGTKLEDIKLLIKDINFKDLEIVYLSELIKE